jgi:hypothetical protein
MKVTPAAVRIPDRTSLSPKLQQVLSQYEWEKWGPSLLSLAGTEKAPLEILLCMQTSAFDILSRLPQQIWVQHKMGNAFAIKKGLWACFFPDTEERHLLLSFQSGDLHPFTKLVWRLGYELSGPARLAER